MKKLLLIAVLFIMASTANAQLLTSTTLYETKQPHRNHFALDLGFGGYTGDIEGGGLALELGFRDTYDINEYLSVDIIKIGAHSGTDDIGGLLNLQAKTGVRGFTPILFGQSRMYANFGLGYGYFTDAEKGGFAWEVGAGLDITRHIAVGFVYNTNKFYSYNISTIGGRVGFTF